MEQQAVLTKLIVYAYKDAEYSDKDSESFSVMFNPTSYTMKYAIEYDDEQGIGTSGSSQKFQKIKPQDFSIEFILDGTGVSSDKVEVSDEVEKFLRVCYEYKGEEHRPRFLWISWSALQFKCVLKTADVTYTLFRPDGTPLRAKVVATFGGFIEDVKRAQQENSRSPDLTHMKIVKKGDTLPLMTYRIYGDHTLYQQVAEVNDLINFRLLEEGQTLYFPPLKETTS